MESSLSSLSFIRGENIDYNRELNGERIFKHSNSQTEKNNKEVENGGMPQENNSEVGILQNNTVARGGKNQHKGTSCSKGELMLGNAQKF